MLANLYLDGNKAKMKKPKTTLYHCTKKKRLIKSYHRNKYIKEGLWWWASLKLKYINDNKNPLFNDASPLKV